MITKVKLEQICSPLLVLPTALSIEGLPLQKFRDITWDGGDLGSGV